MAAFIFWSSSDSRLRFLGGDSISDVSSLLMVILRGLTLGPSVLGPPIYRRHNLV